MTASRLARRRERLATAQGGICPWCDLPLPEDLAGTEVDHIIPRIRGGPDEPWNRQLLHFKCNRTKRFRLTDAAVALATERDIVLREPKPYWDYDTPRNLLPAWQRLRELRRQRERPDA